MSRRKDQERFERRKAQNSGYQGFRGPDAQTAKPEVVLCSNCNRKRNVPVTSLPDDRASFVCRVCQEEQAAEASA